MESYKVTDMTRGKVFVMSDKEKDTRLYLNTEGYTTKEYDDAPYMSVVEAIKSVWSYRKFDSNIQLSQVVMTYFWEESNYSTKYLSGDSADEQSILDILYTRVNSAIYYVAYYPDFNLATSKNVLYLSDVGYTGYSVSTIGRFNGGVNDIIVRELQNGFSDITKLQVYPLGIDRVPHDILYVVNQWLKSDVGTENIYELELPKNK